MSDYVVNEESKEIIAVHCKHYVKRKKRFCKMTLKKGYEYCGEHIPNTKDSEATKSLRIVCPLDNKHTCYAHKLAKHLKICNARPNTSLSYISKGVNCGEVDSASEVDFNNERQLSLVKPEVIKELTMKLNKIYDEVLSGKIVECIKTHSIIEEEIKKPEYGDRTKKHLKQASSIVGLLDDHKLIQPDICYIEFGAGKGQLSYWISQAITSSNNSCVLLVERASHRHKYDNKLDKSDGKVHRIKADIADLLLHKVDVVEKCKGIVGLTKHLCGDATDLALRCTKSYELNGGKVLGLIMAFCCHHRCQWTAYTGKQFFEKHGLSRRDFDIMCGLVSWAICGSGQSRDKIKDGTEMKEFSERDREIGLTREEKEEVGRRCKNILDYGRLCYLEESGFNCSLKYYVSANISPENVCVIATK